MQSGECADHLKVAQLLGSSIHEQIFQLGVVAVEPLDGILHRRGEFAISTAAVLQEHVAESRVGYPDSDRIHELLNVLINDGIPRK